MDMRHTGRLWSEPGASFNTMLAHAFDLRARWLAGAPQPSLELSDRDVMTLALLAQIVRAEDLVVDDYSLAEALRSVLPERPPVRVGDLRAAGPVRPCLAVLAASSLADEAVSGIASANSSLLVLRGLLDGIVPVLPDPTWRVRPLASINPCLWNSRLAIVFRHDAAQAAMRTCARLADLLGDQSLDPLALYDEVCTLKHDAGAGGKRDLIERLRARERTLEHQLATTRQFVRRQIERAVLASGRDAAARNPKAAVDWSFAFLPALAAGEMSVPEIDPSDAEKRAWRARTEAEFLRGQLRSHVVSREMDPELLLAISGFFDITWYSATYNVPAHGAIRHYLDAGHSQGYDPSPIFSTRKYAEVNTDVAQLGINPLLHYLMDGIYEGRPLEPAVAISAEVWQKGFAASSGEEAEAVAQVGLDDDA